MTFVLIIVNVAVAVAVINIMAKDNRAGQVPLFCCRNIFLMGFLFFQNFGLVVWLLNRRSHGQWAYRIRDSDSLTSLIYIACQSVALFFVFVAYRHFKPRFQAPSNPLPSPSQTTCVIYAIGLSVIATLVWGLGFLVLKDLMVYISAGVGSTATGIAAYAWFRDRQNAALFFLLFVVGVASCLPHLTEYGRRGLLSLALVVAWAGHRKVIVHVNMTKLALVTLVLTSPMLVLLAAFSEARVRRPKSVGQAVEYMMEADLIHGFQRLANFQGSAVISMWCMEKYPKQFEYRHLYSARATVHYFIPRAFWPDKPEGLGIQIPDLARLRNVGGLNVGAGYIGHAMAEGGWYALILYSLLVGIGLKWMDGYVESRSHPVYAIPMLSGLGQLFAVPRGEVNFFIDTMFIGIVCSLFCMRMMRFLIPIVERQTPDQELYRLEG